MTDAAEAPHTPAPNDSPAIDADDWTRPFVMRELQLLGDLAEIGVKVARAIERRVDNAGPDEDLRPVAMAYNRTARAVRLTLMLHAKVIKDRKADDATAEKAREEAKDEEYARSDPAHIRKCRVGQIVNRIAEAEHPDDEEKVDRLIDEADERLDDEDLYGDLMQRPLSELVARLCKDLNLDPDWAELAEELWAVRELESGEPGWPLAAISPTRSVAGGGEPCGGQRFGRHANARRRRAGRAERSEERVVEGEGDAQGVGMQLAPSTTRSAAGGPPCIFDLGDDGACGRLVREPPAAPGSPCPPRFQSVWELGAPVASSKPERLRGIDPAQQGRG